MRFLSFTFSQLLMFVCSQVAATSTWAGAPTLLLESQDPLSISVNEEGGKSFLQVPPEFLAEVEGLYDEVLVSDLDGDGVGEIIFNMVGGQVNKCSRVLYYSQELKKLSEILFGGGLLCNFRREQGYVVSAYRDMASWTEDAYTLKDGVAKVAISDACVGCGSVRRRIYGSDGAINRLVVSDGLTFEDRKPSYTTIQSGRAEIYSSPRGGNTTQKYLVHGDEVAIIGIEEGWMEFRYDGPVAMMGWVKCEDLYDLNHLCRVR